jgi:hypothetical protein
MSYPHFDLIQQGFNELRTEGKIQPRSDQALVEADKALITARGAWLVYSTRDPSHGQLYKASGNQVNERSVDWVVRNSDGEGWDVATDQEAANGLREAVPLNGGPYGPDPARIADWRAPSAELAQVGTTPTPGPTPPPETSEIVGAIVAEIINAIAASEAAIMAHDDANTQRILDTIDSIKTQVEESLQKALVLILAKRRRNPDEPVP